MVAGDPFPNDLAIRCDLVDRVVELLWQCRARDLIAQYRQDQCVAVGKAGPIVMLLCRAPRRGLAPLPNDVAIPIKLTDCLVLEYSRYARDHAGLAAGHISELDHYVPERHARPGVAPRCLPCR